MSKAGSKLIKSTNQALAYARGEMEEGFAVHVPEEVDVKSIRLALGLTQAEFSCVLASMFVQCRIGNKNAVNQNVRHGFC